MDQTILLNVLVVEDERIVAWELTERLGRMGCICAAVSSGEEAVRVALDTRPDLVIMDIMLEGEMDGIEAARAIRARLDTPVVFCSAYVGEIRTRAESVSPLDFLEKPMDYGRLTALLSGLRTGSRQERAC